MKENKEQTLYELLGVSETATLEEIKVAYRNKAKEYHPDVNPSLNNEEGHIMMCKINDAYAVLRNPVTRREYDKTLFQTRKTSESKEVEEKNRKYAETESKSTYGEKDYEDYYFIDFDEYLQKEFIMWLEGYIYSYIKYAKKYYEEKKEVKSADEIPLNNLYKSFGNIIDYENYEYNNKYNKINHKSNRLRR